MKNNNANELDKILANPTNESEFKRAVKKLAEIVEMETGLPMQRIYREIAYQAFLNRIAMSQQRFILKGGYALEIQSPKPTRVTTDIDMIYIDNKKVSGSGKDESKNTIVNAIRYAIADNSSDFFRFKFENLRGEIAGAPEGGERLSLIATLCGNDFERVMLDVSLNENPVAATQHLHSGKYLHRISIARKIIEAIGKEQHFAEKIHAYTRPRKNENSRAKDLLDMNLLLKMGLEDSVVNSAVHSIFALYKTHEVPKILPAPPSSWAVQWKRLASEGSTPELTLTTAYREVGEYYSSLFSGDE